MYRMALRRKVARLTGGVSDPYPPAPTGTRLSPSAQHQADFDQAPRALSWARAGGDVTDWQDRARSKLAELTGWSRPSAVPVVTASRAVSAAGDLRRRGVYLRAWPAGDIVVDLVWHRDLTVPAPVMICLQGTNSGAHLSWGEARLPADPVKIAGGLDIARQATARGFVAVCVEQSCFGERREIALPRRSADPCIDGFVHAVLLGRSLIGERARDVSAVIDWLTAGGGEVELDLTRLYAMGHSSGGHTALFATALDPRLAGAIVAGCVGPVRDTVGARGNASGQNIVPGMLNWFDTEDVLGLCAPRSLLVMSGTDDHIYPFAGAAKVARGAMAVYQACQAESRLRTVETAGGHRFDPAAAWPAFESLTAGSAQT